MPSDQDPAATDRQIVAQPDRRRFVTEVDGSEAEVTYRSEPGRMIIDHTRVPEELGGQGIAGELVRAAVDQAREEGLTVVPRCPYARHWLETHDEVAASVEIDWPDTSDDD